MKNKKRCIALILCITILMLSLYVPVSTVQAADPTPSTSPQPTHRVDGKKVYNAFTVEGKTSSDGGKVSQSKSISINYSIKFNPSLEKAWPTTSGGISVIRGTIKYDPSIFETMQITMANSDGDGTPLKYNINYATVNGLPAQGLSAWNQSLRLNPQYTGEENNKEFNGEVKFVIQTKSGFIKTDGEFLQVMLIAKPTANVDKNTKVTLTNLEAGNPSYDYYMADTANNVAKVGSEVEINPEPLIPDTPISPVISDPDGKMMGYIRIAGDTTLGQFKEVAKTKSAYSDFTTFKTSYTNDTVISNLGYIPTGAIATNGKQVTDPLFRYIVFIAVGDINADGRVTATDLAQLQALDVRIDILGDDPENPEYKLDANKNEDWGKKDNTNRRRAADIKWDMYLKSTDFSASQMQLISLREPDWALDTTNQSLRCVPIVSSNPRKA